MPRNALIGVALLIVVVVLSLLIFRKTDGMTKVQRDITKSLERAKGLKAERDSLAKLVERKRFPKQGQEEVDVEEVAKVKETENTDEEDATVNVVNVEAKPTLPSIEASGTGASVPSDRFYTTGAMDGLTPQGKQTQFATGDMVFVYAGIHAPQAEQVRIEWISHSGDVLSPSEFVNVDSNTGSNGYRIYKQRKFQQAGKYQVQLYNGEGKMIGMTEFEVLD